jgi:hypothetical protein
MFVESLLDHAALIGPLAQLVTGSEGKAPRKKQQVEEVVLVMSLSSLLERKPHASLSSALRTQFLPAF